MLLKCLGVFIYCVTMIVLNSDFSEATPGMWYVNHISKCPDDEQYLFQFDICRRKVNRTHDGFSGWLILEEDLDSTYAIKVVICKHVDGGCKEYYVLTDDSFCGFVDKYAKRNMEKCFEMSGIPLPICPIPAGNHNISNYVFDYTELPAEGQNGLFDATAYILQGGRVVSCVQLTVEFRPQDDTDD